jgi:hypothetical protein
MRLAISAINSKKLGVSITHSCQTQRWARLPPVAAMAMLECCVEEEEALSSIRVGDCCLDLAAGNLFKIFFLEILTSNLKKNYFCLNFYINSTKFKNAKGT